MATPCATTLGSFRAVVSWLGVTWRSGRDSNSFDFPRCFWALFTAFVGPRIGHGMPPEVVVGRCRSRPSLRIQLIDLASDVLSIRAGVAEVASLGQE